MQAYDIYADLKHTNNILMELPCFRQMLDENYALSERADSLKIALEYLESKNRRLSKKVAKYKRMYKNAKKSKITVSKNIGDVIDLVSDDDEVVVAEPVVVVKKEVIVEKPVAVEKHVAVEKPAAVEKHVAVEKPAINPVVEPIVMTIEEDAAEEETDDQEEEVVEEEAEEEAAEEEEVVDDQEEAAEEEEVVDDQEEAAEEEEVVDDQEEAEEEEVVDDQEEAEEEEAAEEDAENQEEEEEAEVYEIVIKGKTYYIQNEKDGPIYEADENGEISLEVGVYKNGKPTFF